MRVENNKVIFEGNEKEIWTTLLGRPLGSEISPKLLRELGEQRVRELQDDGYQVWARMAAGSVKDIPKTMH